MRLAVICGFDRFRFNDIARITLGQDPGSDGKFILIFVIPVADESDIDSIDTGFGCLRNGSRIDAIFQTILKDTMIRRSWYYQFMFISIVCHSDACRRFSDRRFSLFNDYFNDLFFTWVVILIAFSLIEHCISVRIQTSRNIVSIIASLSRTVDFI